MGLFDWFTRKKKKEEVQVARRRQNVLQDAAAAAAFAEAGEHETARTMLGKPTGTQKILVVSHDERISDMLADYAVEMAKRLDFELVALNVSDAPLSLAAKKREEAAAVFQGNCRKNIAALQEKAEKNNISFTHLVEIGREDEVVKKLHARHADLRYVLTEPDPEVARKSEGRVAIPVFNLGGNQRAAA